MLARSGFHLSWQNERWAEPPESPEDFCGIDVIFLFMLIFLLLFQVSSQTKRSRLTAAPSPLMTPIINHTSSLIIYKVAPGVILSAAKDLATEYNQLPDRAQCFHVPVNHIWPPHLVHLKQLTARRHSCPRRKPYLLSLSLQSRILFDSKGGFG
ncbi:MAG: hypothetical protein ACYTBJ_14450 [Planctomycetota bacterium]|jgi:hypothetical protein